MKAKCPRGKMRVGPRCVPRGDSSVAAALILASIPLGVPMLPFVGLGAALELPKRPYAQTTEQLRRQRSYKISVKDPTLTVTVEDLTDMHKVQQKLQDLPQYLISRGDTFYALQEVTATQAVYSRIAKLPPKPRVAPIPGTDAGPVIPSDMSPAAVEVIKAAMVERIPSQAVPPEDLPKGRPLGPDKTPRKQRPSRTRFTPSPRNDWTAQESRVSATELESMLVREDAHPTFVERWFPVLRMQYRDPKFLHEAVAHIMPSDFDSSDGLHFVRNELRAFAVPGGGTQMLLGYRAAITPRPALVQPSPAMEEYEEALERVTERPLTSLLQLTPELTAPWSSSGAFSPQVIFTGALENGAVRFRALNGKFNPAFTELRISFPGGIAPRLMLYLRGRLEDGTGVRGAFPIANLRASPQSFAVKLEYSGRVIEGHVRVPSSIAEALFAWAGKAKMTGLGGLGVMWGLGANPL